MAAYDDEMKAAAVGSRYANEIAGVSRPLPGKALPTLLRLFDASGISWLQLFDVRIKARAFGIFDNDVSWGSYGRS